MRTLADMKKDRGGHCLRCGVDITNESQLDHSFCNYCWWDMFKHEFKPAATPDELDYDPDVCDICGEDKDSVQEHITDVFPGVEVPGYVRILR